MWLQHHDVALGAIELGSRAVTHLLGIGVVVGVVIVERIVGHLAVEVIDDRVNASHADVALRRLLGDLGQHAVALAEVGLDVTRRLVGIAILVARLVVKVADVGIVRHAVVELDHRVWRLHDVELRVVLLVSLELHVIDVLGELV